MLEIFIFETEVLRLRDLRDKTGLHKTVLGLLRTLESRASIERIGSRGYRVGIRRLTRQKVRIRSSSNVERLPFPRAVTTSLREQAGKAGVELLVRDNPVSRAKTSRNAQAMIEAGVGLAILFGADEDALPARIVKLYGRSSFESGLRALRTYLRSSTVAGRLSRRPRSAWAWWAAVWRFAWRCAAREVHWWRR